MFKSRIRIISGLFGFCFLIVLGRLWQLQVLRHARYHQLATRANSMEKIVPALRGPILDRCGVDLAFDRPFFDVSVRVDKLKLQRVTLDQVKNIRDRFKEKIAKAGSGEEKAQLNTDLEAELFDLEVQLEDDPFVTRLSAVV